MRAGRRRISAPAEKSACHKAFSGSRIGYTVRKILRNRQALAPEQQRARRTLVHPRAARTEGASRRVSAFFSARGKISVPQGFQRQTRRIYGAQNPRNQPRVHRIGKRPDADQKRARPSTRRADCKSPEQSIGALLISENISMSEQPSSVRFSGIAVSYARHALFAKSAARPAQRQLRSGTANARTRLNRQPLVRKIKKRPAPEQCIETLSMSAKNSTLSQTSASAKARPSDCARISGSRTRRANAAGQSIDTLPLPIRKAACLIRPYPSNVQKRARRMQRRKRNRSMQSYPRRNSKRHSVFEWTAIPVHDLDWHKHSYRINNPYDRRLPVQPQRRRTPSNRPMTGICGTSARHHPPGAAHSCG